MSWPETPPLPSPRPPAQARGSHRSWVPPRPPRLSHVWLEAIKALGGQGECPAATQECWGAREPPTTTPGPPLLLPGAPWGAAAQLPTPRGPPTPLLRWDLPGVPVEGGGCGTPMPRMGSGRAGSGHYGGVSWAEQPPAGRAAPSPAPAPAGEGVSTLATPSPFLFPSERKEWGRGQWMTDRDGHPGCSRPAHSCPVCHQKAPGRCAGDPLPGQGSGRPPSPDR